MDKGNLVLAVHLPGSDNVKADEDSRVDQREIEWKLDPEVFLAVQDKLGVADNIDLFASRVNFQLERYVAWQPDPSSWATDAFSLDWSEFSPYCFPPFSLIPRVLQRLELARADCTLIAPLWTTQAWYTKLLRLLVDIPILLPKTRKLVTHPLTGECHPALNKSRLMACRLSGQHSKIQAFRERLQTLYCHHGGQGQAKPMGPTSRDGYNIVINELKIPLNQL